MRQSSDHETDHDPARDGDDSPSPDDFETRVRARLRARRTERGLSLEALGRRAAMSPSLLSRLESGRRRLSVDHLATLARALEISIDDLLTDPPTPDPRVRTSAHLADDGAVYWPLSSAPAPGAPRAFKIRIPATRTEQEPTTHPGRDWLYVLSGRLRLIVGDRDHILEPGEVAEFATTEPHSLRAVDGPVELITLFGPDGEGPHLHPTGD